MVDVGALLDGLVAIFNWASLGMIVLGTALGIIVGAIPGLTATMAVALLVPVTFFMPPLLGIPMLLGIYKGAMYGGAIPAILISTPGTGAAVATLLDGYPLTQQGKAKLALDTALFASATADFLSDLIFIFLIAQLVPLTRLFGPPEYFALFVFALMIIALAAGKSPSKGLLSGALGLLLSVIGTDTAGQWRYTFGNLDLVSGLPFVPLLIGLFAFSVVIEQILHPEKQAGGPIASIDTGERLTLRRMRQLMPTVLRGTAVGTLIGALPGVGQPVAAMLAYTLEQRFSKNPEKFGKGALEGVAAAEAGNSSVNGPSMIPLFMFGIPGDTVTSVLLGAFIAQGLRPGPELFTVHRDTIYAILMGMVLCNFVMAGLGVVFASQLAKLANLPRYVLIPSVLALAVVGSYAVNNSLFDVGVMAVFGVIGYLMRRMDIPMAPLVITLLLSHDLETNLIRSLILFRGNLMALFDRPIAAGILAVTAVILVLVVVSYARGRKGALSQALAHAD